MKINKIKIKYIFPKIYLLKKLDLIYLQKNTNIINYIKKFKKKYKINK